jgi:hypothetical protein
VEEWKSFSRVAIADSLGHPLKRGSEICVISRHSQSGFNGAMNRAWELKSMMLLAVKEMDDTVIRHIAWVFN